jgi:hypothetical protein
MALPPMLGINSRRVEGQVPTSGSKASSIPTSRNTSFRRYSVAEDASVPKSNAPSSASGASIMKMRQ